MLHVRSMDAIGLASTSLSRQCQRRGQARAGNGAGSDREERAPTRYGRMASQMAAFLDQTGGL
jgi:hypothetical protein